MPKKVTEYRCLLISPSDVAKERDALSQVAADWNAQIGRSLGARVELVKWESHSVPEMGGEAQRILNEQIVDDCDLGVAVFWSRLGTPTKNHPSGSLEEINRLRDKGAPVIVYFSSAPVPQDTLQDEQFSLLQDAKRKLQAEGLLATYCDIGDLRSRFQLHLTSHVTRLMEREQVYEAPSTPPSDLVITAPKPDIRVSAYAALVFVPGTRINKRVLAFSIKNYSPQAVFISRLHFVTRDGDALLPTQDAATGQSLMHDRRLEPGDSTTITIDPAKIREQTPLREIEQAVVTDAIGRDYPVPDDVLAKAIHDLEQPR